MWITSEYSPFSLAVLDGVVAGIVQRKVYLVL
jgi:hypothetical protein